jgi:hypothetical protein
MAGLFKPWLLPGPATFVSRTCGAANRHKVVLLHAPFGSAALTDALRDHLMHEGYIALGLDLAGSALFSESLAAEVGAGSSSPASLATSPKLEHAAIVVRSRGPADPGLATFARLICRSPAGEGPILLVVSEDGGCTLDDHSVEPVRAVFGPLDGAAYAAAMPRSERPLEGRLIASVAIEVAAWDVSLLDRLTALPPDQAVRPDRCVESWDDGETARWRGMAPGWMHGCLDDWGGEPAEHALWLAANKPAALTKRVWRGQLAMLLPWIEQYRQTIIERERRSLKEDRLRSGPDVEALDWGPLGAQLERVPELKRLTLAFRHARNELAHGRPIMWSHIRQCMDAARSYVLL